MASFRDAAQAFNLQQDGQLKDKAEKLWAYLDHLSATDPAAYRAFVEKQKKEKERLLAELKPPPCRLTLHIHCEPPVHVCVCEGKDVPKPESPEAPLPMRFVAFDTDGPENNPLLEVLVNPELLDSLVAEKGSSDQLLERLLLKAAVSRFGSTTSITPQATWSWVKPYQRLSEADRHASEMEKLSRLAQEQQAASAQPPDIKDPQQLLEALSREAEAEKSGKADDTSAVRLPSQVPSTSGLGVGTSPAQAARPKTKPAIVDLSAPASLTEPAHDASVDDNAGVVTLRVHLPGVTSVAEIDLTLSSDSIQVEVLDTYRLKYTTPFLIQTELGSAKFIKKTATLKLKALRVA